MMEREWQGILSRFGQQVTLRRRGQSVGLKALIQPAMEEEKLQWQPTPLGLDRQEKFLYLGPPDQSVDTDTLVEYQGREYRVSRAHRVGEGVCPYWWAVLYPRDEVTL